MYGRPPASPLCPLPTYGPWSLLAGIGPAVRQLRAQADILLLALALCNAGVLQRGPLHVVGIVAVAADKVTEERKRYYEQVQLPVGGKGPAPEAAMRVRIQC